MRLSDFVMLGLEEKKLAVLHRGVLVGKRKNQRSMVFLFHFGQFYVETFCNTQSKAVEEFRVFGGVSSLSPYLDQIPIDDLLN